jgi:hypothetical protein
MADESTRPTFVVSERDVPKLAAQAWDALDRRRPRTVFRRAAELLRAVRGANEPVFTPPIPCQCTTGCVKVHLWS